LQREAYSSHRHNSSKPISAISWLAYHYQSFAADTPIELDKPHLLALATESGFVLFKEQVPLKFNKEISAVQCERKTFRVISLSTPFSFRWTVPFTSQY
jgi:hypothetical protein